jgi:hypothetical protein
MRLKKSEQEFYIVTWVETPNNNPNYHGPENPFLYWTDGDYSCGYQTAETNLMQNVFKTALEASTFVQELKKYPENSKIIMAKHVFTLATDSELKYLLD